MKKSRRLMPVQQLAERRKKAAEQQLGQARQQLSAERDKLIQLQSYLADYQRDLVVTGQAGVGIEQLQRLQSFKQRLFDAVAQQQRQIEFAEQVVEHSLRAWQISSGREQAMASLISRTRTQEQQLEDKQLQKQVDELAQSRYSRR